MIETKPFPHGLAVVLRFFRAGTLYQRQTQAAVAAIKIQQRLPFYLLAAALIWYGIDPGTEAVILLTVLCSLIVASFFWALQMARHLSALRRLRYSALQVGDVLEETITLSNTSWLPVLWAEFRDQTSLPGYAITSVRAAAARQVTNWHTEAACTRRGIFQLGPWQILTGDPFGIFQISFTYADTQEILVYPPQAALPGDFLLHIGAVGEKQQLNQPLPAETILAAQPRAYAPGDPIRRIHWPTTARRGSLYVKNFEPEAASRVMLIPDLDSAVHAGEGPDSSFETMIVIAASLASLLLQKGLSVGLLAACQPDCVLLPPRQGKANLWPLLQALAPLQPQPNLPLGRALPQRKSFLPAGCLPIVITPSTDTAWPPALRRIQRGSAGHANGLVILLHAPSFGGAKENPAFLPLLAQHNIGVQIIRQGEIQPIQGSYGSLNRWDFTTLGTGKVYVRHAPAAFSASTPWRRS